MHLKSTLRVLAYIKRATMKGLRNRKHDFLHVEACFDARYAIVDRKSIVDFAHILVIGNLLLILHIFW